MTSRGALFVLLAAWLVIATVAGATGVVASLTPPRPQLMVAALTFTLIIAERASPWFRAAVASVSTSTLIALHLTRFVGAYFLWLGARGELPTTFATPAGWGDIATAVLAIALLVTGSADRSDRRVVVFAWNVLGLIDLVLVVASAIRHLLTAPASMVPLLSLPLSLLPTFLVPLLLASHVWMIRRTAKGA